MKNETPLLLIAIGILLLIIQDITQIKASFTLEKNYTQLWELADKSSTIPAKRKLIGDFVAALEAGRREFSSHDAVWLQTPNNSFESNLAALRSLSGRLAQIEDMAPDSFQYNTAIQQITAQEQGEAHRLLSVIRGCYELKSYPVVWGWIGGIICAIACGLIISGLCWLIAENT